MEQPAGETPTRPADRIGKAVMWALAASFLASLLVAIPKFVGTAVPALEITFLRYGSGFLAALPFFAFFELRERVSAPAAERSGRVNIWFHALRAVLAVSRLVMAIAAVQLMPLANAQAILLTNGVFMFIFASLILKDPFELRLAIPAVICLAGGIIAANPDFSTGSTWLGPGPLLAFGSALIFGLETVLIRYTALRDRPLRIVFWINAIGTVLLVLPALLLWQPATPWAYALIFLMGPVAICVQIFNVRAFGLARAAVLVPVRYTMIVFGLLIGLVGFNEWPSIPSFFGMALIVGGGMALALYRRRGGQGA